MSQQDKHHVLPDWRAVEAKYNGHLVYYNTRNEELAYRCSVTKKMVDLPDETARKLRYELQLQRTRYDMRLDRPGQQVALHPGVYDAPTRGEVLISDGTGLHIRTEGGMIEFWPWGSIAFLRGLAG